VPRDAEDFARAKLRGEYDVMMAFLIQSRRDLLAGEGPPAAHILAAAREHAKNEGPSYREAADGLLKDIDRLLAWRRPAKGV
jgi:hypothetical protein